MTRLAGSPGAPSTFDAQHRVVQQVAGLHIESRTVGTQRHHITPCQQPLQVVLVDRDAIALQLAQKPAIRPFLLQLLQENVDSRLLSLANIMDEDGGAFLIVD